MTPPLLLTWFPSFPKGHAKHARGWTAHQRDVMDRRLDGTTALVTGANQGIGFQASKDLAVRGCHVIMVCRNRERGLAAVNRLKEETSNDYADQSGEKDSPGTTTNIDNYDDDKKQPQEIKVSLELCDMSSLTDIRQLAERLEKRYPSIDCLVHNAGVMIPERKQTEEGLEMNFATNIAGPFALTKLLLPTLRRRKPCSEERRNNRRADRHDHDHHDHHDDDHEVTDSSQVDLSGVVPSGGPRGGPGGGPAAARVIFVSSGGMLTEKLEVDDVQLTKMKSFDGTRAYAVQKRQQVALSEHLSLLHPDVIFVSMHPGWTSTDGLKNGMPGFYNALKDKMRTLAEGAETITYLACEDVEHIERGGFYLDRKPQSKHLMFAGTKYSDDDVQKLWNKLDSVCGFTHE